MNNFLFIDFQEITIILVVVVLLFGPNSLPEIARGLGTAVRKFKEATNEIKSEILNPQDVTTFIVDNKKEFYENFNPLEKEISNEVNDIKESLNPFEKRIKRDDS
ncbi:MAG: twin-arginine translocase TatA/TatE family subunit [Solirubrobacteraceae bacterium]